MLFWHLLLASLLSSSDYRVYRLEVTDIKRKTRFDTLSTMDPFQYTQYHTLNPYQTIVLKDHWMCWERKKRFAPLCQRPGDDRPVNKVLPLEPSRP